MLFLSDSAIRYAAEKCNDNDNYKVCICTSNRLTFDYACDKVYEVLDSYAIKDTRRNRHGFYAYFENGSIIRIFTANIASNGTPYHLLISDKSVDRKILEEVLMPWEKLEWLDYCSKQNNEIADE